MPIPDHDDAPVRSKHHHHIDNFYYRGPDHDHGNPHYSGNHDHDGWHHHHGPDAILHHKHDGPADHKHYVDISTRPNVVYFNADHGHPEGRD